MPVSVSHLPTPPHSARPEGSAERCSESMLPYQANDDRHVRCEQSAEPDSKLGTKEYDDKLKQKRRIECAAHTIASIASTYASNFIACTVAGADFVVIVNRAARSNSVFSRSVFHDV